MDRLGLKEGEVITHPLVSRSIERAQKKVEGNNFQIRKHLLEYDDVMNQQREVIYDMRLFALEGKDMDEDFKVMLDEAGGFTPTPVISHAILGHNRGRESGLADGVVITPSHNPPEDNGFKVRDQHGGAIEQTASRGPEHS